MGGNQELSPPVVQNSAPVAKSKMCLASTMARSTSWYTMLGRGTLYTVVFCLSALEERRPPSPWAIWAVEPGVGGLSGSSPTVVSL